MKGLNYPSGKGDWEKSPRSNPTVALNVLYDKKIKTHSLYISEHKILNHDNIIILLIKQKKKDDIIVQQNLLSLLLREKR